MVAENKVVKVSGGVELRNANGDLLEKAVSPESLAVKLEENAEAAKAEKADQGKILKLAEQGQKLIEKSGKKNK